MIVLCDGDCDHEECKCSETLIEWLTFNDNPPDCPIHVGGANMLRSTPEPFDRHKVIESMKKMAEAISEKNYEVSDKIRGELREESIKVNTKEANGEKILEGDYIGKSKFPVRQLFVKI